MVKQFDQADWDNVDLAADLRKCESLNAKLEAALIEQIMEVSGLQEDIDAHKVLR